MCTLAITELTTCHVCGAPIFVSPVRIIVDGDERYVHGDCEPFNEE